MPSFEVLADIFTCLSAYDSSKGSSNTVKTVFQKKAPIIYKNLGFLKITLVFD